jgi:hypothetical protein
MLLKYKNALIECIFYCFVHSMSEIFVIFAGEIIKKNGGHYD